MLAARVTALAAAVPPALRGEPIGVHQARVASRRLREIVPILVSTAPSAGRADAAVRRVTRALGPVRELDVTAALYAERTATDPVHPVAHDAVRRALVRQRAAAMRATRRTLSPAHRTRLWTVLETLAGEAGGAPPPAITAAVEIRLGQRARRVTRALGHLGVLYAPDRLHAVRIAVKQLRYSLEVAGVLRRARVATSLRQLRSVQEMLGRAHDLHVLGEFIRRVEGRVVTRSRPAARDLRRLADGIDGLGRQLHAAFLSRRGALLAVAAAPTAAPQPTRRRVAA